MAGNAIMATAARNPWLARLMATPKPELPSGLLGAAGAYYRWPATIRPPTARIVSAIG